jgi:hypothetical protein
LLFFAFVGRFHGAVAYQEFVISSKQNKERERGEDLNSIRNFDGLDFTKR